MFSRQWDLGRTADCQWLYRPLSMLPVDLCDPTSDVYDGRDVPFIDNEVRIFVIDDNVSVLTAVERLLRANGFRVDVFRSPVAFLEQPPFEGIACLLLDLRMPVLSGLDVQEALRRKGLSLPIVFLSGHGDVPTTARAMREGAVDF